MRKILYLGTDPVDYKHDGILIHCSLIETIVRPEEELCHLMEERGKFTHLIFSSKHGVRHFFDRFGKLEGVQVFCVGETTGKAAKAVGYQPVIARSEMQEGIIDLLRPLDLNEAYVCVPCAAKARGGIGHFLAMRDVRHQLFPLYDTVPREVELPDLSDIHEIVFTSPSVVDAFFSKAYPKGQVLKAIGPVTRERLRDHLR